jgi:hypothetical protein
MKNIWLTIVAAIVCAVVFFFIGQAVGKGSAASAAGARGSFSSSTRGAAGRAGAAGGGFASGQVVSVDGNSLTVQLPNGNSEVVFFSSSTQVIKPQVASLSALTPGTQVLVGGTANSDGSVSAQTIQIRQGSSTPGFGGRGQ